MQETKFFILANFTVFVKFPAKTETILASQAAKPWNLHLQFVVFHHTKMIGTSKLNLTGPQIYNDILSTLNHLWCCGIYSNQSAKCPLSWAYMTNKTGLLIMRLSGNWSWIMMICYYHGSVFKFLISYASIAVTFV